MYSSHTCVVVAAPVSFKCQDSPLFCLTCHVFLPPETRSVISFIKCHVGSALAQNARCQLVKRTGLPQAKARLRYGLKRQSDSVIL